MMEPWQKTVAEYDRKAHRQNGMIVVTFTGSFRAMDAQLPAERTKAYTIKDTHYGALDLCIANMEMLRSKAVALDDRIELRKRQSPHERRYMYDE